MSDAIVVRGIHAAGHHGLAELGERSRPQPFVVDVELRADLGSAAAADELEKAIDYRDIAREVRRVVENESFELVETLAEAIAAAILRLGGKTVCVRVSKLHAAAAMRVDEVAVVVER